MNSSVSWQIGLVEMEINEILKGRVTADVSRRDNRSKTNKNVTESSNGRSVVQQREISEDDVCPICQDEFMSKKLPVTFCK